MTIDNEATSVIRLIQYKESTSLKSSEHSEPKERSIIDKINISFRPRWWHFQQIFELASNIIAQSALIYDSRKQIKKFGNFPNDWVSLNFSLYEDSALIKILKKTQILENLLHVSWSFVREFYFRREENFIFDRRSFNWIAFSQFQKKGGIEHHFYSILYFPIRLRYFCC